MTELIYIQTILKSETIQFYDYLTLCPGRPGIPVLPESPEDPFGPDGPILPLLPDAPW